LYTFTVDNRKGGIKHHEDHGLWLSQLCTITVIGGSLKDKWLHRALEGLNPQQIAEFKTPNHMSQPKWWTELAREDIEFRLRYLQFS
jgi:hypothetical protein